MFFSSPNLLTSSLSPYLPGFTFYQYLSPSLQIMQNKVGIKTNKNTKIKHPPPKRPNHQTSMQCVLYTLGHGACPRVWLICPVTLHWRKLILPFPAGAFPVWGFCLIWTSTDLVHVITASVGSHVCNCCCVWKMLLPWSHPLSLAIVIFLTPFQQKSLSLEGRVSIKAYHLELNFPKSFTLWTLSNCGSSG